MGLRCTARRCGPRWMAALFAALQGTPSVDAVHSTHLTSNDVRTADRDAVVLDAISAVLETHVPVDQSEAVDPLRLALVRRCRWALLPYVSAETRAKCLESFLHRYVDAAQSSMFDVVGASPSNPDIDVASPRESSDQRSKTNVVSLEDGAKMVIVEAIEAFTEASVLKIPLTASHYRPFVSFPGMVQLDPDIIENILIEYEERHPSAFHIHSAGADTHDIRCLAAASYAAAGFPQRAVAIAKPEHLPAVVERAIRGRRGGWVDAMNVAACVQSNTSALTRTPSWSPRDGRREPASSIAPLLAVCSALDWANRSDPNPSYFNVMLPPVASTVVSWASVQHNPQMDAHSRDAISERGDVEALVAKVARAAHPASHWQQVLLVYHEYLKGVVASARQQHGVAATSDEVTRGADESLPSTTPTGRVMHVLLLANRWRDALNVFQRTPKDLRDAHTSSFNYYLTAIGGKLAAVADEVCPPTASPLSDAHVLRILPEAALADTAVSHYAELRTPYAAASTRNTFTHIAFLRALTGCSHLVGLGSTEVVNALRSLQSLREAQRLIEECALHGAFGGTWETAVALVAHQHLVHRSRYIGPIALIACAQQFQEERCLNVLQRICNPDTQLHISRKQLTLCFAALVACSVGTSATSPTVFSKAFVPVLEKAISDHELIRSQKDYDEFVAQFLAYLSSAVLHRSRAADVSFTTCDAQRQPSEANTVDEIAAHERFVAATKDRTSRAQCVHVARRNKVSESIAKPENLLSNLVDLLEVPPRLTNTAAVAELRSAYRVKANAYSGSMRVGWLSALEVLAAASKPNWSTSSLPTLLMDAGFHQDVVMACL